jgi:hypothetical protein
LRRAAPRRALGAGGGAGEGAAGTQLRGMAPDPVLGGWGQEEPIVFRFVVGGHGLKLY